MATSDTELLDGVVWLDDGCVVFSAEGWPEQPVTTVKRPARIVASQYVGFLISSLPSRVSFGVRCTEWSSGESASGVRA